MRVLPLATLAGLILLWKTMSDRKPKLQYFQPSEFGVWWPMMDDRLLILLDRFRERLGRPVMISPAEGSLGRLTGSRTSMHYAGGGVVRAADVMLPEGPDLQTAYLVAREVGFTGIGLYPFWKPYPGLHLDVRPDRTAGNPATWSRTASGEYVGIERAFA